MGEEKMTDSTNIPRRPDGDKTEYRLKLLRDIEKNIKPKTFLDVGGADALITSATHVIDRQPFRAAMTMFGPPEMPPRITEENWCQRDFYDLPWPYKDGAMDAFDFVWCVQVLEDVKDPIVLCKEMNRIGKAGYIECPGVLGEVLNNYWHHRWFIRLHGGKLQFLQKSGKFVEIVQQQFNMDKLIVRYKQFKHIDKQVIFHWDDNLLFEEIIPKDGAHYEELLKEWIQEELDKPLSSSLISIEKYETTMGGLISGQSKKWVKSGIMCLKCGGEMEEDSTCLLASLPPKKWIRCPRCKHKTTVIA